MAAFSTVVTCKCRKSGVLAGCLTRISRLELRVVTEFSRSQVMVCLRTVLVLPALSVTRAYRVSSRLEVCASEKSVFKDALLTFPRDSSRTSSSLGRVDSTDGIVEGDSVLLPRNRRIHQVTCNHANCEDEDLQ